MREVEHEAQLLGDLNLGYGRILALHDRSLFFVFICNPDLLRACVGASLAAATTGPNPTVTGISRRPGADRARRGPRRAPSLVQGDIVILRCHWLSLAILRDSHTSLAALAVLSSKNDSVAPG